MENHGSLSDVYITSTGSFFPGHPISNEKMEQVLGLVGGRASRYRKMVLRANRIKYRHYALNDSGESIYLNEEMAAFAARNALDKLGMTSSDLDMLAAGTTIPDLVVPGFASMVHGRLGGRPLEILSAGGVCVAGMAAMKAAYNAIRLGQHRSAVSVASEMPSAWMKSSRFEQESDLEVEDGDQAEGSYQYFNADFLRWMLSDAAGAVVLQDTPSRKGLSLRIDWFELRSYAHKWPVCMYMGTDSPRNPAAGSTWATLPTASEAERVGMMMIRQDTKLLNEGLAGMFYEEFARLRDLGRLKSSEIDHFFPHISSYYFYRPFFDALAEIGCPISEERWFVNLAARGNTGSASIYTVLDDAMESNRIKAGEKVLLFVPESGRFSVSLAQLTCVDGREGPAKAS